MQGNIYTYYIYLLYLHIMYRDITHLPAYSTSIVYCYPAGPPEWSTNHILYRHVSTEHTTITDISGLPEWTRGTLAHTDILNITRISYLSVPPTSWWSLLNTTGP